MFSADDEDRPSTPLAGGGRIPVEGADGWYFLPIEPDPQTDARHVRLVRDDGVEVAMTLPEFVQQGDELTEIARLVIRARDRVDRLKGLGA